MPTALRVGPYRFFFYSGDRDELPHVLVERDDKTAKYWLEPIRLESNRGFSRPELGRIQRLLTKNHRELIGAWHDYFRG
jgi:hypothetical protein